MGMMIEQVEFRDAVELPIVGVDHGPARRRTVTAGGGCTITLDAGMVVLRWLSRPGEWRVPLSNVLGMRGRPAEPVVVPPQQPTKGGKHR